MKRPRPEPLSSWRSATAMIASCALWFAITGSVHAYESGRADFALRVNDDLVVPYRVFALYVLPTEVLQFYGAGTAAASSGPLERSASGAWRWTAPAVPGIAVLRFRHAGDEIQINAVILHPADRVEQGHLNDYRIDAYPEPLNGDPVYEEPDGFIELNDDTIDLQLSPHFRLGQFPSKQSVALPKYLTLREPLLLKLELLLERLNEAGIAADSLTVMSGFRTPMYNRALGNGRHSRHIYGGAADVYVDVGPADDVMDDLNRDGVTDLRDAQWLYRLADELFSRADLAELRGGLGVYDSTSAHGPFLHLDARGRRARWGLLP